MSCQQLAEVQVFGTVTFGVFYRFEVRYFVFLVKTFCPFRTSFSYLLAGICTQKKGNLAKVLLYFYHIANIKSKSIKIAYIKY